MHTWCTRGEQLFCLFLFIDPPTYFTSIFISIPLSILPLSLYLSPYLYYLYLDIYEGKLFSRCSPGVHQVCARCSLFGCAPCDHCSPGVHQVCTRCALGCAPGVQSYITKMPVNLTRLTRLTLPTIHHAINIQKTFSTKCRLFESE